MADLGSFRIRIRVIPLIHMIYSLLVLICGAALFPCLLEEEKENESNDKNHECPRPGWPIYGFWIGTCLGLCCSIWILWTSKKRFLTKHRLWMLAVGILTLGKFSFAISYSVSVVELQIVPQVFAYTILVLDLVSIVTIFVFLQSVIPPITRNRNDVEEFIPTTKFKRLRILRTTTGASVSAYFNINRNDPVNLELGKIDGLFHHHYGIGKVEINSTLALDETALRQELHRLESAQANFLLSHFGKIREEDHLLDLGCGRGGTCIMVYEQFGCFVDGVSISDYQVQFANAVAKERGITSNVKFHFRNMLNTGFPSERYQTAWNNESTMYVPLDLLFDEVSRILKKGGRYLCITGAWSGKSKHSSVKTIDSHYSCKVHKRNDYLKSLMSHGFSPVAIVDLTQETIPYWELRKKSSIATGIEKHFLDAFRSNCFHYILIVADKN